MIFCIDTIITLVLLAVQANVKIHENLKQSDI